MTIRFARIFLFAAALALGFAVAAPASAAELAKNLFGHKDLPAATPAQVHGFYSKGCFSGGLAIAVDGPHWQAMRVSRNRRWGHPAMIILIERLSREAVRDGWPGLLVGDISQPRGGPMLTGHASHQVGLDADIWFTPMPADRLSLNERENVSATSLLKGDTLYVDDRKWTKAHEGILRRAASYPEVERIFVHPGIKKKLCDTVTGDRSWMSKIRPFWGHHYHFHIRIKCPPNSPGCRSQTPPPRDAGCDDSLAWWFTEEPWRPSPGPEKPKARDVMTMADLPNACRAVLDAPAPPSEQAVTLGGPGAATPLAFGEIDPARSLSSMSGAEIPVPTPRPQLR